MFCWEENKLVLDSRGDWRGKGLGTILHRHGRMACTTEPRARPVVSVRSPSAHSRAREHVLGARAVHRARTQTRVLGCGVVRVC